MIVFSEASQSNTTKQRLVDGLKHAAQSDSAWLFVPRCFIIDYNQLIIDSDDRRGDAKGSNMKAYTSYAQLLKDNSTLLRLQYFHSFICHVVTPEVY